MLSKDKHILIVDDSPNIRRILVDGLQKLGYAKLTQAEDAVDAFMKLRQFSASPNPVDFVISDLNMPGPSGMDLLKQIRADKAYAELPFVMVTTESEKGVIVEAAVQGVSGFVVKPFNFPTLADKINRAWAKHFP